MIVQFDWIVFQAMFPQFASAGQAVAQMYFDSATLYVANTDCAIIPYDTSLTPPITTRATILNWTTAHLMKLFIGDGTGPSPFVGPVSDATQGSVSVSTTLGNLPASATWWATTTYGFNAWGMMAPFRTGRYQALPGRFAQNNWGGPLIQPLQQGAPFSNRPWGGPWQ